MAAAIAKTSMNTRKPKDIAKDLIRPYVKHETVDQLADSYLGVACSEYWAQVGGYAVLTHGKEDMQEWASIKLGRYEVAVTEINGKEYFHRFNLHELYTEIEQGEQLSLF
jgi:hypothetical protein